MTLMLNISSIVLMAGLVSCSLLQMPSLQYQDWAYDTLLRADTVYSAHVSIGGEPSDEGCALQTMLRQKNSEAAFSRLYAEAGAVGKIYAVMGLCLDKSPLCDTLFADLSKDTTPVETLVGCIGGDFDAGGFVIWHRNGFERFSGAKGCWRSY